MILHYCTRTSTELQYRQLYYYCSARVCSHRQKSSTVKYKHNTCLLPTHVQKTRISNHMLSLYMYNTSPCPQLPRGPSHLIPAPVTTTTFLQVFNKSTSLSRVLNSARIFRGPNILAGNAIVVVGLGAGAMLPSCFRLGMACLRHQSNDVYHYHHL